MIFPCSRCGACCRAVGRIPKASREGLEVDGNGVCRNLNSDNTCSIYEKRPTICRVDQMIPNTAPRKVWYLRTLDRCNTLHREVYGTPRIPFSFVE